MSLAKMKKKEIPCAVFWKERKCMYFYYNSNHIAWHFCFSGGFWKRFIFYSISFNSNPCTVITFCGRLVIKEWITRWYWIVQRKQVVIFFFNKVLSTNHLYSYFSPFSNLNPFNCCNCFESQLHISNSWVVSFWAIQSTLFNVWQLQMM